MKDRAHGPREELAVRGAAHLSDAELVAILLGTGLPREPVAVLASRLLTELGGPSALATTNVTALARIAGVGSTKAARLVAAAELGRRLVAVPLQRGQRLRSADDVAAAFRPRLAKATVESFLAITLDAKHRIVREICVAVGGLSACPVSPADVFRAVLREDASAVIFVHNHPSGESEPSEEDILLTARLRRAAALLGVRVLDHVIVSQTGHFSFVEHGLLDRSEQAA
jgi:DNA repair protein RadC